MVLPNKTNEYSEGISRLPEERLREYIEKPDDFHEEAVLAAIWELRKRRPSLPEEKMLEKKIEEKTVFLEDLVQMEVSAVKSITKEESPSLYSMRSISVFSVLFSVIAGGILMAVNFNRISKRNEALKVLGFSIIFTLLSAVIFSLLGTQSPYFSLFLNLIGAFLIDQLFWKRVLGKDFRFMKQPVWTALAIALLLITPIIWYAYKVGAIPGMQ